MQAALRETAGLEIIEAEIVDLVVDGSGAVAGVLASTGEIVSCGAVALTTGTFLRGVIVEAQSRSPRAALARPRPFDWASGCRHCSFPLGRLKTGTPPRLDGKTIDWAMLERQAPDPDPAAFLLFDANHRQSAD